MAWRPRTPYSLLMVATLPLLMAACANPGTESAATQWSFDGTQYAETSASPGSNYGNTAATASSNAAETQVAEGEDWVKKTYVYRGGRDPKTGLAAPSRM